MAGIDFMAFINGMREADKLNKEDETRWRTQQREDIAAQNLERNQAYLEKTQGYNLDEMEQKAQSMESGRLTSQAVDMIRESARVQGKHIADVLMEAQPFQVEGNPYMQARLNENINSGLVSRVAYNLRLSGDIAKAEALERKYGMSSTTDVSQLRAYSDRAFGEQKIMAANPGATKNEDGSYNIGGVRVPYHTAVSLAINPQASPTTLENLYKQEQLAAAGQKTQETLAAQAAKRLDEANQTRGYNAYTLGSARGSLTPEQQVWYDRAVAEAKGNVSSGGANLVGGAGSIGTYTDAPKPAGAGVPTGNTATNSVAPAMPNYSDADWRESLAGGVQTDPMGGVSGSESAPPAFENAVNHLSSQELEALRYNITSGKGIPGMSATANAVALRTINDEIASRHKAQQMRMQRGSKQ